MAWKEVNVSEQRMRFVLRAASGEEEMAGLCREFEISRTTGYEWLKRYQQSERITELQERSRRPLKSPSKTKEGIEARVVEMRRARPDWGARKFQVLLKSEQIELPVITIHRILQRHGLIRPQHQHPPALKRFERERPNQLWQMDFKGLANNLAQGCTPLSVLDDYSRYLLCLAALGGTQMKPVRQTLQQVFERDGLPEAMLMDHGTPWWNANHPWGWTRLSIWLMKQGIRLHFAAVRHPQTQGKVERFHRTLQDALHERGFPTSGQQWTEWLSGFRQEYNHVRPHQALNMATPVTKWMASDRAYRPEPPRWEYTDRAQILRVRPSGQICVGSHLYTVSGALGSEWVALEPITPDRYLVFYCQTCIREIDMAKRQSYPVYFSREQNIFDDE